MIPVQWLSIRITDAEIAVCTRLARARRRWLRTAPLEAMPGHPERVRAPGEEQQESFAELVDALVDEDMPWVAARMHQTIRAGWRRT